MTQQTDGYLSPRLDGGAICLACPNGRGGELVQTFTAGEGRRFVAVLTEAARQAKAKGAAVRIDITDGAQSARHDIAPDDARRLARLFAILVEQARAGARDLLPRVRFLGQRN